MIVMPGIMRIRVFLFGSIFVDLNGDYLVDENGNYLVEG